MHTLDEYAQMIKPAAMRAEKSITVFIVVILSWNMTLDCLLHTQLEYAKGNTLNWQGIVECRMDLLRSLVVIC